MKKMILISNNFSHGTCVMGLLFVITILSPCDLTFSYSGVEGFQPFVDKAVTKGMRMAVVFRKESEIPMTFKGIMVVSGDKSDVRHLDDDAVIVGLYAKGQAKLDNTGFVV